MNVTVRIDNSKYKADVHRLTCKLAHRFCKNPRINFYGKAPCKKCVHFWNMVYFVLTFQIKRLVEEAP